MPGWMRVNSQAFECKSSFPLPESVRRLGERVRENGFSSGRGRPAVGRATADEVRFYWYPGPDFVTPFKPNFYGRFQEVSGQVFLRGQFEYSSSGKRKNVLLVIFLVISACFVLFGVLLDVMGSMIAGRVHWIEVAISFSIGVLSLGAMIWFRICVKRTWRSETKALIGLIERALAEDDTEKAGTTGS